MVSYYLLKNLIIVYISLDTLSIQVFFISSITRIPHGSASIIHSLLWLKITLLYFLTCLVNFDWVANIVWKKMGEKLQTCIMLFSSIENSLGICLTPGKHNSGRAAIQLSLLRWFKAVIQSLLSHSYCWITIIQDR